MRPIAYGRWGDRGGDEHLPPNQNGWTLLELLLAIALLVIVVGAVYGSFRATISAITQSEIRSAPARQARVLLSRLSNELTSTDWAENRPETLFVGTSQDLESHPADSVTFSNRSHVWYPTQPLAIERAVITYEAESGPAGLRLWRREEANPFVLESHPDADVVVDGLAGIRFRYFSDGGWAEAWNAADSKRLPELVEIILTFGRDPSKPEEFRTLVALPKKVS